MFIYNKEGFREVVGSNEISNIEVRNRSLPPNERLTLYEGNEFPPKGKVFEKGVGLREATEKDKVLSGEIPLVEVQNRICDKINLACGVAINSGFESSALGEVYIYDSEGIDQINLIGSVASGGNVLYKCTRQSDGVRDFYTHTNTQIKKVLGDAANRKIALLQKCYQLKQAVLALTDYDSVISFKIDMELA